MNENKVVNIAIDGPAGAGKSTVAKGVAKKLGFTYLDTGAMYRAMALKAALSNVAVTDTERVKELIGTTKIDIEYDDGVQTVLLDGKDVSKQIREHHISKMASDISKIPEVRLMLVALQRQIAQSKSVVVDGRDIASFVLPSADVKVYLTAKSEIRARRRYDELVDRGEKADYDEILRDVNDRDYNDMNRSFAPLVKTEDSVEIDSSQMTIEQVIERIVSLAKSI